MPYPNHVQSGHTGLQGAVRGSVDLMGAQAPTEDAIAGVWRSLGAAGEHHAGPTSGKRAHDREWQPRLAAYKSTAIRSPSPKQSARLPNRRSGPHTGYEPAGRPATATSGAFMPGPRQQQQLTRPASSGSLHEPGLMARHTFHQTYQTDYGLSSPQYRPAKDPTANSVLSQRPPNSPASGHSTRESPRTVASMPGPGQIQTARNYGLQDNSQHAGLPPSSPTRPAGFKFLPRSSSARQEQHASLLSSLVVQQVGMAAPGSPTHTHNRMLTFSPQPHHTQSSKTQRTGQTYRIMSGSPTKSSQAARQTNTSQHAGEDGRGSDQTLQRRFSTGSVASPQHQWPVPGPTSIIAAHLDPRLSSPATALQANKTLTCVRPSTANTSNFAIAFAAESQQELDHDDGVQPAHRSAQVDEPVSPGMVQRASSLLSRQLHASSPQAQTASKPPSTPTRPSSRSGQTQRQATSTPPEPFLQAQQAQRAQQAQHAQHSDMARWRTAAAWPSGQPNVSVHYHTQQAWAAPHADEAPDRQQPIDKAAVIATITSPPTSYDDSAGGQGQPPQQQQLRKKPSWPQTQTQPVSWPHTLSQPVSVPGTASTTQSSAVQQVQQVSPRTPRTSSGNVPPSGAAWQPPTTTSILTPQQHQQQQQQQQQQGQQQVMSTSWATARSSGTGTGLREGQPDGKGAVSSSPAAVVAARPASVGAVGHGTLDMQPHATQQQQGAHAAGGKTPSGEGPTKAWGPTASVHTQLHPSTVHMQAQQQQQHATVPVQAHPQQQHQHQPTPGASQVPAPHIQVGTGAKASDGSTPARVSGNVGAAVAVAATAATVSKPVATQAAESAAQGTTRRSTNGVDAHTQPRQVPTGATAANTASRPANTTDGTAQAEGERTSDTAASQSSSNPLHMFAALASQRVPVYPPRLPHTVDDATQLSGHISTDHTAALHGYTVGKVIGEGGFCQVRLAVHRLSGRRVAVKVIDKLKLADASEARRIQREIRVMRHLTHECIIKLLEVVDTPTILYLVMEHAPSGSLLDYVRSRKHLAEADAVRVVQQIVAGLAYCHQREVVHRDIKLENILLDANSTMKLIDFGLSAFFIPGKQLRVHCGSPSYAAPEIVSRKHYDGPPVDVWSLGVVLFAMLAGHLPFHSSNGNKQELCSKIMEGRYTCPEHISAPAKDLLSRMLCVDPSRRITLPQVLSHPWVMSGGSPAWEGLGASVYMVRVDPSSGLVYADEQLVEELEGAGYTRGAVLQHLLVNDANYITAAYFLLAEGKVEVIQRMRGEAAAQRYIQRAAPTSSGPSNNTDMSMMMSAMHISHGHQAHQGGGIASSSAGKLTAVAHAAQSAGGVEVVKAGAGSSTSQRTSVVTGRSNVQGVVGVRQETVACNWT